MGGSCAKEASKVTPRQSEFGGTGNTAFRGFGVLEFVNVPIFGVDNYLPRTQEETNQFLTDIGQLRDNSGVLVVSGPNGSGKTTFVTQVFNGPEVKKAASSSKDRTVVLWLNCDRWEDEANFDENSKRSFSRALVDLAAKYDDEFDFFSPTNLIQYFKMKRKKMILFVFDNLTNPKLLQFFFDMQKVKPRPFCIAITRNAEKLTSSSLVKKVFRLEPVTSSWVRSLFDNCYKVKTETSEEKFTVFAKQCSSCLLQANLVRGLFDSSKEHSSLEPAADGEIAFSVVCKLLDSLLESLDEDSRNCFFDFLIFDPEEILTASDLAICWGQSSRNVELLELFKKRFLIFQQQHVDNNWATPSPSSAAAEEHFFVPKMSFEACLVNAAKRLEIGDEDKLRNLRFKIAMGRSKAKTVEMILFNAVRQQRLEFVKRIVAESSGEHLAKLCQQIISSSSENNNGQTFLQFLYTQTWPAFDVRYRDGHESEMFGRNTSYRLIHEILLKLKKEAGEEVVFQVVSATNNKDENSFFMELFRDSTKKWQFCDRLILIEFLDKWKRVFEELDWKQKMLSDPKTLPTIRAIIVGNELSFEKMLSSEASTIDFWIEVTLAAARCNNLRLLQYLYSQDNGVTKLSDKQGKTALMKAAGNGNLEIVKFLCEMEKSVISHQANDGKTSLMSAAACGHLDVVEFLFDVDPNCFTIFNKLGWSALLYAAKFGHLEIVQFFYQKARQTARQPAKYGWTHVMIAARSGNLDVVRYLLEQEPVVVLSQQNGNGATALMLAIESGNLELVKYLVDKDPSTMTLRGNDGRTALMLAAGNGLVEIVECLVAKDKSGILLRDDFGFTCLAWAVRFGHLEVVRFLYEVDNQLITLRDEMNYTPFSLAAQFGYLDIFKFLFNKITRTSFMEDHLGLIPLLKASANGHLEVVKFIIDKDGRLVSHQDGQDGLGRTALMEAAESGYLEVVKFIYAKDPNCTSLFDPYMRSALTFAAKSGHLEVVKFLFEKDSKMASIENNDGMTPLMVAISYGRTEVVNLLEQQFNDTS